MLRVTTTITNAPYHEGFLCLETRVYGTLPNGEMIANRTLERVENFMAASILEIVLERHSHIVKDGLKDAMKNYKKEEEG